MRDDDTQVDRDACPLCSSRAASTRPPRPARRGLPSRPARITSIARTVVVALAGLALAGQALPGLAQPAAGAAPATTAENQSRPPAEAEAQAQAQTQTQTHAIIDADEVNAALARGAIVWDVRGDRDYDAGHIPGAVSVGNIHQVLRDPNREDWIATARIAEILGKAGIDIKNRELVVYGQTSDSGAYYVLNGMQHFGARDVKVYHGGIDDWQAGGRPLSRERTRLAPVTLALSDDGGRLIDNPAMLARVREGGSQILDVRTPGEFSGEDIRAIRGGHVPGAVHIPYEQNWIDPRTGSRLAQGEVRSRQGMSLRPDSELRSLYAKLDPDREVVVYCQSGVRASVTATILRDLGFRDVKVYEPSWLGYAGQLSAPAENEVFLNVGALNNRIGALQGRIGELEAELRQLRQGGRPPVPGQ